MAHEEGLLVRLASYSPREGRDAREDFATEALAHLLSCDADLRGRVGELFGVDLSNDVLVVTQESYLVAGERGRFDLVLRSGAEDAPGDHLLILENKVEGLLEVDQVERYRRAVPGCPVGVIAGSRVAPDGLRAMADGGGGTWRGIHTWAELRDLIEGLNTARESVVGFLRRDFVLLLSQRGYIMERVERVPRLDRVALASVLSRAAEIVDRGLDWRRAKLTSGADYLFQSLKHERHGDGGMIFWDREDRLLVGVASHGMDGGVRNSLLAAGWREEPGLWKWLVQDLDKEAFLAALDGGTQASVLAEEAERVLQTIPGDS